MTFNFICKLFSITWSKYKFKHVCRPWFKLAKKDATLLQAFNEISSREMEKINVLKGILKNYVFVAVLSCTVIFQIIIVEFLGTYANTCPLSLEQWFASIVFGFLSMPIAAAVKLIPVGSSWVLGTKGSLVLIQFLEIVWRLVSLACCQPVKLKLNNFKAKVFWICCYRSAHILMPYFTPAISPLTCYQQCPKQKTELQTGWNFDL